MFFLELTWVLYLIVSTEGSMVLDSINQEGIYVRDYCPKMEHCPDGTHVMCMHYDSNHLIGPNCGNGFNVSVSRDFVQRLLDVMNEIRAKVASGDEVGKDNEPLPRAYGMIRVKWDSELATFAQIWANRCVLRHDLCRATKRFSNPGQTVGITRFTYPDWRPVKDNVPEMGTDPGLNDKKVWYSMTNNMKLLYRGKAGVTKEMIYSAPNLDMSKHGILRGYLDIVSSATTHVGCGLSASTSYYGQSTQEEVLVNILEVVCNFAGSLVPGQKVYETDLPKEEGWTAKCGCPPGYREDEDCLCVEGDDLIMSRAAYSNTTRADEILTCSEDDANCESLILLPIITVEDAPPEKLYHAHKIGVPKEKDDSKRYLNNVVMPKQRNIGTSVFGESHISANQKLNVKILPNNIILKNKNRKISGKHKIDVRKRYFDNVAIFKNKSQNGGSPVLSGGHISSSKIATTSRRDSIFTKVLKFKLPVQNNHKNIKELLEDGFTFTRKINKIIKDVTPRKDYSNIQKLAIAYLNKKHNKTAKHKIQAIHSIDLKASKFGFQDLNISVTKKTNDSKNSNEEDTKLLSLLDNLEQEVNRNKLNGGAKDIIDAKMRTIYGDVVRNSDRLVKLKRLELLDDVIESIEKKNSFEKLKSDKDKAQYVPLTFDETQPDIELTRPIKRNQNSIKFYDKPSFEQYQTKHGIIDTDNRELHSNYYDKIKSIYIKDDKIDNYIKYTNINKNEDTHEKLSDDADLRLGHERRKYYQDKINNLERKIQSIRGYRRQNKLNQDNTRHIRPVITPHDELEKSRSTNNVQSFYVPDRAKFIHGF